MSLSKEKSKRDISYLSHDNAKRRKCTRNQRPPQEGNQTQNRGANPPGNQAQATNVPLLSDREVYVIGDRGAQGRGGLGRCRVLCKEENQSTRATPKHGNV